MVLDAFAVDGVQRFGESGTTRERIVRTTLISDQPMRSGTSSGFTAESSQCKYKLSKW
jgi:hypothetical protein